jgi:hypothetical protein
MRNSDRGAAVNGALVPDGARRKRSPELRKRAVAWKATLQRELEERPERSAAIALGAGYVIGGGLFSPLTARLVGAGLRIALRLALIPLATQSLVKLGQELIAGPREGDEAENQRTSAVSSEIPSARHSNQKETQS